MTDTCAKLMLRVLKERGTRLLGKYLLPNPHRRGWTLYSLTANNSPYIVGTFGVLFDKHSLWVGVNYNHREKLWRVNLLPCCTVWVTEPGGKTP